jgi:peroxiredoxin
MSSLRFLKKEGGLDMIINKENFTASSSSETPNLDNTVFNGSPENSFLIREYKEQSKIKTRLGLLQGLTTVYKSGDVFYGQVKTELAKVETADKKLDNEIKNSPLYAATFLQLRQFADELSAYPQKQPAEIEILKQQAAKYINADLYHSGLWLYTLQSWTGIYRDLVKNENTFVNDAITLLKKQYSEEVLNGLGNNLMEISEQNNWEKPKMQIAYAIYQSGTLPKPTGTLAQVISGFSAVPGNKAPEINLPGGNKLSSLSASQYVVFFYESGCGHCDDQINWIKQHYSQLTQKGVQVISITSDTDQRIARLTMDALPWTEKLCDLKGFEGEYFKIYGVIGTPTIFVLDKDKIITGKFAHLEDAKILD